MIKFFRHIRRSLIQKNQMGKYFKYAIGEIILVVIGILIALSINNWNQKRIQLIEEKKLVQNILNDLEADNRRFVLNLEEGENILQVYKQLYEIGVVGKDIIINKPHHVRRLLTMAEVLNKDYTSISDNISNASIKERLHTYDLEQKMTEVAFKEFRKVIEDRIRIYLGEKELYELERLYNKPVDEDFVFINAEKLIALAKTIEFQQLLFEAKLKLDGVTSRLKKLLESNLELRDFINEKMDYYQ
ncbi:DUF6090 family protein [Ichthyenterobacterium sp. W332]|uniref:DUF6090 family protein n=1 Tax=Microcosmobacter mediterraneus TaxID=3075607 RepID=A0ABU2YJC5_9FLAO|nr:DUF6090 family protein [Ichthyenterobacterium sp. W332]MDT0558256.1 DUF6090 family protein [Ichthyenterobacterium sp. W332]